MQRLLHKATRTEHRSNIAVSDFFDFSVATIALPIEWFD